MSLFGIEEQAALPILAQCAHLPSQGTIRRRVHFVHLPVVERVPVLKDQEAGGERDMVRDRTVVGPGGNKARALGPELGAFPYGAQPPHLTAARRSRVGVIRLFRVVRVEALVREGQFTEPSLRSHCALDLVARADVGDAGGVQPVVRDFRIDVEDELVDLPGPTDAAQLEESLNAVPHPRGLPRPSVRRMMRLHHHALEAWLFIDDGHVEVLVVMASVDYRLFTGRSLCPDESEGTLRAVRILPAVVLEDAVDDGWNFSLVRDDRLELPQRRIDVEPRELGPEAKRRVLDEVVADALLVRIRFLRPVLCE